MRGRLAEIRLLLIDLRTFDYSSHLSLLCPSKPPLPCTKPFLGSIHTHFRSPLQPSSLSPPDIVSYLALVPPCSRLLCSIPPVGYDRYELTAALTRMHCVQYLHSSGLRSSQDSRRDAPQPARQPRNITACRPLIPRDRRNPKVLPENTSSCIREKNPLSIVLLPYQRPAGDRP